MKFYIENFIDYYLLFIIFVKIVFVISSIGHLVLSHSINPKGKKIDKKLVYWKQRTEFIFIVSMAILLMFHFNPIIPEKHIDGETSLLFFLFGLILILTADWNLFIKEARWYQQIVNIFK